MIDYQRNWFCELDDGLPRRVKCCGCDRRVLPDDLSPSGHCPVCVGRGQDDARAIIVLADGESAAIAAEAEAAIKRASA